MIVKCVKNRLAHFEEGPLKASLRKIIHLDENEDIGIKIGGQYTVYGINLNFFIDGMPFYYICEDERSSYPVPISAAFFETIDSRVSKNWRFVFNQDQRHGLFLPEWADDEGFYERLVDGNQKEEIIFSRYKKLIDDENIST